MYGIFYTDSSGDDQLIEVVETICEAQETIDDINDFWDYAHHYWIEEVVKA
jgi:hypothetical protein